MSATHLSPKGESALTPCCDKVPFELPLDDRMTLDVRLVTCQRVRHVVAVPFDWYMAVDGVRVRNDSRWFVLALRADGSVIWTEPDGET